MSDNAYTLDMTMLHFGKRCPFTISYPAATPAATKTAVGTNGTTTLAAGGLSTFTDATAAAFSPAMVGQTITVTGGSHSVNDGVFQVIAYISATQITIYNPNAVVDSSLSWAVLPNPVIIAGDQANQFLTVTRSGVGICTITTVDPFGPVAVISFDPGAFAGSTSISSWVSEQYGQPVQNINGQHPIIPGLAVPVNSWSVSFILYSSGTATDPVPTKVANGTHGAPVTTPSGAPVSTFVDATAASFTAAMVGSPITISGDAVNAGNNGTFTVVGYVNSTTILISNSAAVTTSSLTWSITQPATIAPELVLNTGPVQ